MQTRRAHKNQSSERRKSHSAMIMDSYVNFAAVFPALRSDSVPDSSPPISTLRCPLLLEARPLLKGICALVLLLSLIRCEGGIVNLGQIGFARGCKLVSFQFRDIASSDLETCSDACETWPSCIIRLQENGSSHNI